MGKIGVYGGSFNPPHLGHMQAVQEMAKSLELDRVLLVPAAIPPHKDLADGSPTGEQRLEMLRLASEGMEGVETASLELRRKGLSYTADTVKALHEKYPKDKLYLLMGTDMFLSFHEWYKPEKICKHAAVVTALRADTDSLPQLEKQAERLKKTCGAKTVVLENSILEMSSTEVRRMLRFQCAEPYLNKRVLDYIRANRLYGAEDDLRGLPFDQLRKISLSLHDPKRVPHVVGCCSAASHLALRWGADESLAARAGILHDVTKALGKRTQLLLCEKYGIMTTEFERDHYKLLHARTGAAIAEHIFGEEKEVVDAIYWHTTGKANMTLLEKILYIADYMEPNRNFDGVRKMRELTETDLDGALLLGFEMSIDLLKSENKPLDRFTVEARDFLLNERTKV